MDKNGFDAGGDSSRAGFVSQSGSAAAYIAVGPFLNSEWGGTGSLFYTSRRSAAGWATDPMIPPPTVGGLFSYGVLVNSEDLSKSLIRSSKTLTADPGNNWNYYIRDNVTGAFEFLYATEFQDPVSALSDDGSHLAIEAREPLTDESDQLPKGYDQPRVYDYDFASGQLRLVSREPGSDAPFLQTSVLGSGPELEVGGGAVSDDGSQIFFSAPWNAYFAETEIYRRSDGQVTALASPSKRTTPDPNGSVGKIFEAASSDGNRVFFRSCERLTDDANDYDHAVGCFLNEGELYRYDFETDELIDLTAGTPGSAAPGSARGVLGISDDGDRAYFATASKLTSDAPDGADCTVGSAATVGCNLYLWTDDGSPQGAVRFIGRLAPSTRQGPEADESNWNWGERKTARVTVDGRYLVFQSRAPLTAAASGGTSQVYVYDAEGSDGAGSLTCISCPKGGSPAGTSFIPRYNDGQGGATAGSRNYPRAISSDGRVVFSTPTALSARDTNEKYDAYLWEDGRVYLLSTGSDPDDSYAFGISDSGADAFFRTREQLVAQDGDTVIDIYTAHVNGGFLSQQAVRPARCSGEGCRSAASQPPAAGSPATSVFSGPGDPTARTRTCPKGKRKVRRHGKVRCVKKHKRRNHKRSASTTRRASR